LNSRWHADGALCQSPCAGRLPSVVAALPH
jgi:hypothetical protein